MSRKIRISRRNIHYHWLVFRNHDFKASLTVFFVALPLCLGIALASGAPVESGLIAGIVGGLVIAPISGSQLSVSGPAAGLTAVCAGIVTSSGIDVLFGSIAVAGLIQIALGILRLGGFTYFIPSSVIKGMLAAIGLILVSKQVPTLLGYDKPDFWSNELFNIITFRHVFSNIQSLYHSVSMGAICVSVFSLSVLYIWKHTFAKTISVLPTSFVTVALGAAFAVFLAVFFPNLALTKEQFVNLPTDILTHSRWLGLSNVPLTSEVWTNALTISFVASLESLLSIEAIDKIDPQNRITPQNRELIAQGTGNFVSGILGGLPVTAVIVRSSANAEAGGRTWMSAFFHGIWLLLAVTLAFNVVNQIPYCVLAAILIRTGYNLAKPSMFVAVWKQGREQFMPFAVAVVAILFTDLLIGVLIGLAYSIYFLIKHTYRAGYSITERREGHIIHYKVDLALNVSFLNKKKISNLLDGFPPYSVVEINGSNSVYIDHDILEIFQQFRSKAHYKHIELVMRDIPEVQTISLH